LFIHKRKTKDKVLIRYWVWAFDQKMGQIENWLQFAYVANLLERKGNYIKKTGSKGRGIGYYSVRNLMV